MRRESIQQPTSCVFEKDVARRPVSATLGFASTPAVQETCDVSTSPIVRHLTAFIALSAVVSLGAESAAQREPQEPRQPPIRTQANYVRVDAYPTQNGQPVLGLKAEDFQVYEDGALQAVTAFEHVVITSAGPQAQRREPNSVEAARQEAMNPRSRVFVIYLDAPHTTIEGTWHIREPLIRLIDRILGPDDLVGIMTPEMAPQNMTLARKTEVVEKGLREGWPWGYRHTLQKDERDWDYESCYSENFYGDLARQLIARRRERMSLEALNDLVFYLRDLREERKAILTVSEGWLLYRPNPDIMRLRKMPSGQDEPIPGVDEIGVGPGGRLARGRPLDTTSGVSMYSCWTDRTRLAQMDNDQYFRDIIQNANRANASFYTVDPRGLAASDTPLGPEPPLPLAVDQLHLRTRLEAIRTLATATDGIWVTGSNDLHQSLKRIADDLTSYYLLGYYSTNAKLDGKFRKLDVRVKRPGVDVRARRGYRAPTEAEVATARAAAAPPVTPEAAAVTSAMDALARIRPEARFRICAAAGDDPSDGVTRVWIAGEMQAPPASDPWTRGGTGDIEINAGGVTASGRVTLAVGERAFLTSVTLAKPATGALDVRARLTGSDPGAARLADSIRVPIAAGTRQPLLFRRGPTTGNKLQPAATFLFSRTERLRLEIPVEAGTAPGTGQLLDRTGKLLSVPVSVGQKTGEDGGAWITADVTLAPLGAGDYAIEVTSKRGSTEEKTVTAIRVAR